ncbi:DNA topoisomerase IV subunit B [Tepidamorphus sp. 3E244]|uniref:DNA topoisomerase IV subunit B n=1 Tax=Tepidamorphus sp. 3E244 TaxID=3385498 RepID=UPI0038FCD6B2
MSDSDDLFAALDNSVSQLKTVAKGAARKVEKAKPAERQLAATGTGGAEDAYTAADIEVLEGLEPVRRRPGMYIGGTDEKALHHLFAEVIDNAMDEAVAGHASVIEVNLDAENYLTVTDNGRGIPVDPHPKYKNRSALEVILTTLHAGGKFDSKVYETSGGLHGVGVSVVNALSDDLEVEVARGRKLYRQYYSKGSPTGALESLGDVMNRRGTKIRFHPDAEIFGKGAAFKPARLFRMARSKAYLFGGVEIRWSCDPSLVAGTEIPAQETFKFPDGLKDYLESEVGKAARVTDDLFFGKSEKLDGGGRAEWAICWFGGRDGFVNSYCNTVPTPEGGTHVAGLRLALLKGLKAFGELTNNKKLNVITSDDVLASAGIMLSVFVREPEFQGQTKERLTTQEASRIVENAVRDAFDHWLAARPQQATRLLEWVIDRAEERLRRRQERETQRKTATRKLRLPGKLSDCSANSREGTELFIVEGDSAGGSAKQARARATQAVLPLRGKILNVASAGRDKLNANQQLSDLVQALGCGTGSAYRDDDLRYERIIIMTDADVDGAHIASLLITYFYKLMPQLIDNGHLFLAVPPLYRISQGGKTLYARDDMHKDELMSSEFNGRGKIEIGRFKGLGEMMPHQLKETTMDPKKRTLLRVEITAEDVEKTRDSVSELMGTNSDARFRFIQDRAEFAEELDV